MSAPTSTPNTYGMITKYQLYQERRLSVTVVTRDTELHYRMTGLPVIPVPLRANANVSGQSIILAANDSTTAKVQTHCKPLCNRSAGEHGHCSA